MRNHNNVGLLKVYYIFFVCLAVHRTNALKEEIECQLSPTKTGRCVNMFKCQDAVIPGVDPDSKFCSLDEDVPIVCCSQKTGELKPRLADTESPFPLQDPDYTCGYPYGLAFHTMTNDNGSYWIYHLNETATKLQSEGYTIEVNQMFNDAIRNFTYSNGSFVDIMAFTKFQGIAPVGSKPASQIRAYYMALLGEHIDGNITWLCDGVLINRQWILSAAHCFFARGSTPNVIRLGEYDWENEPENYYYTQHEDYGMEKVIVHPKYSVNSRYHDLVLIKIPKPIAKMQHSMNPICLPWANDTNTNHVGKNLTLTGWGATSYRAAGGEKTAILQEVDVVVFNTSVCDESYSKLLDYKEKWSQGMTDDTTLCAGSEEGGKDACKGDSGAPLTYQNEDDYIILAAIVSGGFGCGLKDFPGLYIPINNPFYLEWIRETAFTS